MTDALALVAWLRQQLDEDERITAIIGSGGYAPPVWRTRPSRSGSWVELYPVERTLDEPPGAEVDEGGMVALVVTGRNEHLHIVRHDPARVLREIAAKRKMLSLYEDHAQYLAATGAQWDGYDELAALAAVVRLLAEVYSDRPGYLDEWRL